MTINEEALALHAAKQGKIAVESTVQIQSMHDLALAYSPGVPNLVGSFKKTLKPLINTPLNPIWSASLVMVQRF